VFQVWAMEVNVRPPPNHFSKRIFVRATEVKDDVSRATSRISHWHLAHQQDGTHRAARCNGHAGQDLQSGNLAVSGRRDDAEVGGSGLERVAQADGSV